MRRMLFYFIFEGMKNILVIIILLLSISFYGQDNLDTSSYPSIRGKIIDQTYFINHGSDLLTAYKKRSDLKCQIHDYIGAIEDFNKVI